MKTIFLKCWMKWLFTNRINYSNLLEIDRIPHLTPEDIRNPQDFLELERDPIFNYEDGMLKGYLSVRSSYQAWLKE